MRIEDFDIIHLHFPFIFGAELIALTSIIKKIPFVLTYHNDLVGLGYKKLLFNIYSVLTAGFVMGQAKKLIAVNIEHAKQCQQKRLFLKHHKKIVEIPNGVDTKLFIQGMIGWKLAGALVFQRMHMLFFLLVCSIRRIISEV